MGIVPFYNSNLNAKGNMKNSILTHLMPKIQKKKQVNWIKKKGGKLVKDCYNGQNCECGESKINENDKTNLVEMQPWQVTVVVNWKGAKNKVPDNLICQGVLISKKHVLTAYHCLEERKNNRLL